MNWQKYDIDPSKVRGGKAICPKCSHERKNKRDLCLSVDLTTGLFNCHHCGFKGCAVDKVRKEYTKPAPRLEKVGRKMINFFEGRGISNDTLLRLGITEALEKMPQIGQETTCICFNYYRDGELVNIKFRDARKGFKMQGGAELIFYNLDAIKDESECVIVEGEIDCLSMHESGVFNSVSVPNGASKGNQKLEYLDNCWKYFESKSKVILAVDGDEAGKSLAAELARRIGKEKCFEVKYPDGCKDANEVLLKYGKGAVKELVENATALPLDGIMTMDEIYPDIERWYNEGYPKGARAQIDGFDELLTFVPKHLTIITGIPGHGKDEFTNYIMVSLAKNEGWKWGICGFEESPAENVTKLLEKYRGKCFDYRINEYQRLTPADVEEGIVFIMDNFFHINTESCNTDLDGILEKATQMVKRYGIRGFCMNPWNWIEHNKGGASSETEYVSEALTKIVMFAKRNDVHVFLIAHTTKMSKDKHTGKYEVPTLYSISGSAHFFNKTHNGITVYRDYETNNVDVYVQKVKQSWLGKLGFSTYQFDTFTRQYIKI